MNTRGSVLLTVFAFAFGISAQAGTVAFDITGNTEFSNGSWVFGLNFTPVQDLSVTSLGYFQNAGIFNPHEVGIFSNPSGTLLGSATITSADLLTGNFRFQDISPINLTAGESYRIVGVSHDDPYSVSGTQITDPAITFDSYGYFSGTTLTYGAAAFTDGPYFGPNFVFGPLSPDTGVPEPQSWLLAFPALLAVISLRRRKVR